MRLWTIHPGQRDARGQLGYEWSHLLRKLRQRAPEVYRVARKSEPEAHDLFRLVAGPVAEWEVLGDPT